MKEIFSFFHGVGNFLKNISKNMYKRCAILTVGTVVIAVVNFNSTCYGGSGKNNVTTVATGNFGSGDTAEEDASDDEAEEKEEIILSADNSLDSQHLSFHLLAFDEDLGKVPEIEYARGGIVTSRMSVNIDMIDVEADEDNGDSIEQETATETSYIIEVTQEDYDNLVKIVEAEATGLDLKAKILVANVVINRVYSNKFPNTVSEVIFQENGAQFQPIKDGRFYSVALTDSSYEAVEAALCGEDYSEGALYFASTASAGPNSWFAKNLVKLFEYNGHVFFKEH